MGRSALLAIAALLLDSPALAQDNPTEPSVAPQGDVIINGTREVPKNKIESDVRALTQERRGRQLSRWNDRICVKVIGLWPQRDRLILDRIAAVAKKIDVDYAEAPKCTANTIIFFTTAADKFVKVALDKFPGLVKNVESFGLPQREEKAPYLNPRPVRWLPVNATELSEGALSASGGSRIIPPTRESSVGELIIVDETRLDGIKWAQLADYLAMVTFAQPALDADFSTIDSVMALFSARDAGRTAPVGLTRQDAIFLAALYRTPADRSVREQRDAIEKSIGKALNGK